MRPVEIFKNLGRFIYILCHTNHSQYKDVNTYITVLVLIEKLSVPAEAPQHEVYSEARPLTEKKGRLN